ncbi:hypothetical protein Sjap_020165 [Stephania japonica]|uniref:Uncharacterized protein n=1 Tax=Stephania japonica TaxID=461633 RepID=A0AAP0F1K2_9MAGN
MLPANNVPHAYNGGKERFTQGLGFNNPNNGGASNYTMLMVNNYNGGVLIGGTNTNRAGDGKTSFSYARMEEELNRVNRAPGIGDSGENSRNSMRISVYVDIKGKGIMIGSSNELTSSAPPPTFPNVAAPVEKPPHSLNRNKT